MRTRIEIRENISDTIRDDQINSLIDEYINLTLQEINDPSWSFDEIPGMKGYHHNWSFNRRKTTIPTVASQEFYNLPRDLDKISLIRQTTTPMRIKFVPDDIFYHCIPNPTSTGTPRYYRLWEEEGVSTTLAVADKIDIVSSSASDGSSITATVVGYSSTGFVQSETYTLNGITTVSGTKTFAANKPIRVSKSAATTGNITVTENSGGETLVVLGPEDRSPRFKVMGLYPIPSAVISLYLEYYTRIRNLTVDADVPNLDEKWIWVVRSGTLAKAMVYKNKPDAYAYQKNYAAGVRAMVKSDMQNVDYIPTLRRHDYQRVGLQELSDDEFSFTF